MDNYEHGYDDAAVTSLKESIENAIQTGIDNLQGDAFTALKTAMENAMGAAEIDADFITQLESQVQTNLDTVGTAMTTAKETTSALLENQRGVLNTAGHEMAAGYTDYNVHN